MAGRGIQHQPIRYPREAPQWFVQWHDAFIRDVLSKLDVRNAAEGLGITIEGTPDQTATISASEDLQQLFDADFLMAEANGLLPNARTLAGEFGVISVDDAGPGGAVTIGVEDGGLQFSKLQQISPLSVLGNEEASPADVRRIASAEDDTVFARVAGALGFFKVTSQMIAPPITMRYLQPVTNGDPLSPEVLFDDTGDLVFSEAETF